MHSRLFASLATVGLIAGLAFAAPVPVAGKVDETTAMKARKALDAKADFKFEQTTFPDAIAFIKDRFDVIVTVDPAALNQMGIDPSQAVVAFAKRGATLREGLKAAFAPYSLRYGITADGIWVGTEESVIAKQMRQPVSFDGGGRPLAAVLQDLANQSGTNIVIDPRAIKKAAESVVPLRLDDVPLETAVRLAAEVAGYRAVRMNNVLFVTTEDRAKVLREDGDGPTPISPFGGGLPGGPDVGIAPAVIPAPGAAPALPPPPAAPAVPEKPPGR